MQSAKRPRKACTARVRRVGKSHVNMLPSAGGIGAARNLAALTTLAITHVVNASPIVPCFHAACLRYRTVAVFDDCGEDIAQFFEATNRWISKVRDWAAPMRCVPILLLH